MIGRVLYTVRTTDLENEQLEAANTQANDVKIDNHIGSPLVRPKRKKK